jgi:RNA recognition motif-containing protein
MASKIYVGNLNYRTTEDTLRTHFEQFGEVASVSIIVDRYSGQSKGFGFVEMSNPSDASAAIEALNGRELDGRQLRVNEANPREERPRSGGGRGEYRGY